MRDLISNLIQKTSPGFYSSAKLLRNKTDVWMQNLIPFHYNPEKYKDTFLINDYKGEYEEIPLKRIIYCFWTGNNPMSENRKRGLKSLEEKTGVQVKLVTPENLNDFILPEAPIHPAYQYLSLIHRADYLRCYFMHNYGGGGMPI